MNCILIVNKNGLLSACPTDELFAAGAFHTDPNLFVVVPVKVTPKTYQHLYENRDNAFVLMDGLPERSDQEGHIWYKVDNGYLKKWTCNKILDKSLSNMLKLPIIIVERGKIA